MARDPHRINGISHITTKTTLDVLTAGTALACELCFTSDEIKSIVIYSIKTRRYLVIEKYNIS